MAPDRNTDPTRVTNQPAVQRPRSGVWLVASGALGLIAIVLFAFSLTIVAAWAWIGIAVQAAIFVAMLATALTGRRRAASKGYTFAVLLCVQAAVALLVMVIILIAAWVPAA